MTQPTPFPTVTITLPSMRSVQKLGRDGIVVAAATLATFLTGPHGISALNLNPEESTAVTGVLLFAYRWMRGLIGKEPQV